MKTHIISIIVLSLLTNIILPSCKKDEPQAVVYPVEDMFVGYLAATGFEQNSSPYTDINDAELGLEFTPLVTGKITILTVKIPDERQSLRVTIWQKYPTPTVIRTENLNIATANTTFEFDIPDLELTKDTTYAISMNTNDYYEYQKNAGANATYPVTVGNINIQGFGYKLTTDQLYMTAFSSSFYAGNASFKFQRTN